MAVAQLNISGYITGLKGGARIIGPLTINATSASASAAEYTLTTAFNTPAITIPAGTTAMVIVPPASNTTALFMAGDTAASDAESIDISPSNPTIVSLAASSPTVYLKTASSTVVVEIIFV